jgi:hypothetical protein
MSLVDVALLYVADGLPVFPLRPRSREPWAGSHGFLDATLDPELVRGWWAGRADSNIGIATGTPGGIVVVDIDSEDARHALDELGAGRELGGLVVRTGRGWHRWYETPAGVVIRNSRGRLAAGIDVRGVGGYVVAPPSVHESGTRYAFVGGDLVLPPDWLLDALHDERATPSAPGSAARGCDDYDDPTTPWGRAALERSCALVRVAEASAGKGHPRRAGGGSHSALFRSAYYVAGCVAGRQVNRREAEEALLAAALDSGLADEEDLRRQIRNAFEGSPGRAGGLDKPIYPPPSRRDRIRAAERFEEAFE